MIASSFLPALSSIFTIPTKLVNSTTKVFCTLLSYWKAQFQAMPLHSNLGINIFFGFAIAFDYIKLKVITPNTPMKTAF